MKKLLFLLAFLLPILVFSQSVVPIRGDTIKMYKVGGNAYAMVDSIFIAKGGIRTKRDTLTKFKVGDSNTVIFVVQDSSWYNWNGYWYVRQAGGTGGGGFQTRFGLDDRIGSEDRRFVNPANFIQIVVGDSMGANQNSEFYETSGLIELHGRTGYLGTNKRGLIQAGESFSSIGAWDDNTSTTQTLYITPEFAWVFADNSFGAGIDKIGKFGIQHIANLDFPTATKMVVVDNDTLKTMDISAISGVGEVNTASNVGAGTGVFKSKVGVDLQFKSLTEGYGIKYTSNTNDVAIRVDTFAVTSWLFRKKLADSIAALITAGSGEINTASNVGSGAGWWKTKIGVDLQFKTFTAGWGGILTPSTNEIDIKIDTAAGKVATKTDLNSYVLKTYTLTTGYGLTGGGDFSAPRTLKADTATGGLATLTNVNSLGINLPLEHQLKTIYEAGFWPNLGVFSVAGTMTPSITAAGHVQITTTTANYTPKLIILPQRPTSLSKVKITTVFKITAWAATSNWFGPNLNSIATVGSTFGLMGFTGVNSAGTNTQYIASQDGTVLAGPTAGPSRSLNDELEISLELNDSVATLRVRNITTASATTTLTYTYPSAMTTILPNIANFALMYNSSAGGTLQVKYIKIESGETVAATVATLGNSKTRIGYADYWGGRFGIKLNNTYPTAIMEAGSAETMQDMIKRLPELMQLNPEQWLLADIYSNDVGAGTSFEVNVANFKRIYQALSGGGRKPVRIMCFPEDSTAGGGRSGLTAFKNWLVSYYPNDIIDTWTALDANGDNRLSSAYYFSSSDRIHLNQAGQDLVLSTIIASGKITTQQPNRRAQTRQTDQQIIETEDSLSFRYQFSARPNFIPKFDSAMNQIVPSRIYDDGTKVFISDRLMPKAFQPAVSGILNVEGTIFTYGDNSGVYMIDRSNIAQYSAWYNNSNLARFNLNGSDLFYFSNLGHMQIGNRAGTDPGNMYGILAMRKSENIPSGGLGEKGMGIFLDTATFTHQGTTTVPLGTYMTIGKTTWAATGATTFTNISSLWIDGPVAGTNVTATTLNALTINAGISEFKAQVKMSHTGATLEAIGTTAQRPTATAALFRYNSDSTRFEGYNGSAWKGIAWNDGSGGVGGSTPMAIGGTITSATVGSLLFVGTNGVAAMQQKNSDLFYDSTNRRMGIGAGTSLSETLVLGLAGTRTGTMSLSGVTSGKIIIQPASAAGTYTLTLPTTDGEAGEMLKTDGSGVLAWLQESHIREFSLTTYTTVANTTTETTLVGAGTGSTTVEAAHSTAAGSITIKGSGVISTHATGDVDMNVELIIGNYNLGLTFDGAHVLASGLSNSPFSFYMTITPAGVSGSGNAVIDYFITVDNNGTPVEYFGQTTTSTFANNSTVACDFNIEWDAAQTDNSATLRTFKVVTEKVN